MSELHYTYSLICQLLSPYSNAADINRSVCRLTGLQGVQWEAVIDMANDYLVTPALWNGLKSKGLALSMEDPPLEYFSKMYALNKRRNKHLRIQLIQAIGILNSVGITPLLLKGASQLVQPIHKGIGCRLMSDLDILILPKEIPTALKAFANHGYEELEVSYDFEKLHHWAPLIRNGDYSKIELHRQALNNNVTHVLPTPEILNAAERRKIDNTNYLLPNPTHSILIGLLHSREFNRKDDPRQYNLRALADIVNINWIHSDSIDWKYIKQVMAKSGLKMTLESYLVAARQYFNMPYPQGIRPGPAARVHHKVCIGIMQNPILEFATRHVNDYSAFQIRQFYGCSLKPFSLSAYRMRYLAHYIKIRLLGS